MPLQNTKRVADCFKIGVRWYYRWNWVFTKVFLSLQVPSANFIFSTPNQRMNGDGDKRQLHRWWENEKEELERRRRWSKTTKNSKNTLKILSSLLLYFDFVFYFSFIMRKKTREMVLLAEKWAWGSNLDWRRKKGEVLR